MWHDRVDHAVSSLRVCPMSGDPSSVLGRNAISLWAENVCIASPPNLSVLSENVARALVASRLPWSAAEPDLVSVGIAVRDLAHAVGVGFPLHRVESPIG
jgi:hypothetical protein